MCLDAQHLHETVAFAREALVVGLLGRARKPASQLEVAVDPLIRNEPGEILTGLFTLAVDADGALLAKTTHVLGKTVTKAARGDAAVTSRSALPRAHRVEDLYGSSGAGESEAGGKPRVARSDNHHVATRQNRRLGQDRGRCSLPPVRLIADHRRRYPTGTLGDIVSPSDQQCSQPREGRTTAPRAIAGVNDGP